MFKKLLLAVFLLVSITSCNFSNDKKKENYAKTEIETKKELVKDILNAMKIEDAEIFCLAHFRYGVNETDKSVKSESFGGSGFEPEGPQGQEGPTFPQYDSQHNVYKRFDLAVNYNDKGEESVHLQYVSYLILLDNRYESKIEVLDKVLSEFILNRERVDVLTIELK